MMHVKVYINSCNSIETFDIGHFFYEFELYFFSSSFHHLLFQLFLDSGSNFLLLKGKSGKRADKMYLLLIV